MFSRDKSLRDMLSAQEIAGVDGLLRRLSRMISESSGLSNDEKADVVEGQKAINRLFYPERK